MKDFIVQSDTREVPGTLQKHFVMAISELFDTSVRNIMWKISKFSFTWEMFQTSCWNISWLQFSKSLIKLPKTLRERFHSPVVYQKNSRYLAEVFRDSYLWNVSYKLHKHWVKDFIVHGGKGVHKEFPKTLNRWLTVYSQLREYSSSYYIRKFTSIHLRNKC